MWCKNAAVLSMCNKKNFKLIVEILIILSCDLEGILKFTYLDLGF